MRKIVIKVRARAAEEYVKKVDPEDSVSEMVDLIVSVKEPLIDNLGNDAVVRAVARFYNVPPSYVRIIAGNDSPFKTLAIEGIR